MKNSSITLTIELDSNELDRVAHMLSGMAMDLDTNRNRNNMFTPEEINAGHIIGKPPSPDEVFNVVTEIKKPEPPAPTELTTMPGAVEVDSAGLPWDARIHGAAKKKLAKEGTWKKIRNVDPLLVSTVESELGKVMTIPVNNGVDELPKITGLPIPPAPIAVATLTFPELIMKITSGKEAGTLNDQMIQQAVNNQGLESFPLLAARPDLIPGVDAELFA